MSADYLWDRTGPPDPEIARLERVLSTLASGRSVGARPSEIAAEAISEELGIQPSRWLRLAPVLAAAAALLVGLGVGYGLGTSRQPEVSVVADPVPLVVAPPLAPVPSPTAPAGSEAASAEPRSRAPAGPSATPAKPPAPPPARSEVLDPWARTLSSAQVSSVVSRNSSEVRSRCWQPALAGRSPSAPDTARLSATLRIAASGSVQSATVSEAPGYAGLSRCVAERIRRWRFPSAERATTAHVPFVFAAPSSSGF